MQPLHLFEGYGIELEYMIANRGDLAVLPISDRVMHQVAGLYVNEVERGPICWSNELVLHVIEMKVNGPARSLEGLAEIFDAGVTDINGILALHGGQLLGTAMHPFMNPQTDMRLWPHDYNPIYEAFDRIFSCKGHGWANLQSMHINLPFANDPEFGRLHAAIRLVLPILPALAASSPIVEGCATGFLDNRMNVYRNNSARIPSIAGLVIPEPVFTEQEYREKILAPIYRELGPLDPDKTLQEEWVNARGAIARFERNAIEIRVIDVQECPRCDLAIAWAVTELVRALVDERWCPGATQRGFSTESLAAVFLATIRDGEHALIEDDKYLSALGFPHGAPCRAGELWRDIVDRLAPRAGSVGSVHLGLLDRIIRGGTLASRILKATGPAPGRDTIGSVYVELADCLRKGLPFRL